MLDNGLYFNPCPTIWQNMSKSIRLCDKMTVDIAVIPMNTYCCFDLFYRLQRQRNLQNYFIAMLAP